MRYLIICIYIVYSSVGGSARPDKADSLIRMLRQPSVSGPTYKAVLDQVYRQLEPLDSTAALARFEAVRKLYADRSSPYFQAYARRVEALLYQKHNRPSEAITLLQEACLLAQRAGYRGVEADMLQTLGIVYRDYYQYPEAIRHLLKARQLYTRLHQQTEKARTLYHLGLVYYSSRKYMASLNCLEKVYSLGKDSLDKRILISTVNTLGLIYKQRQQYTTSISYFRQSLHLAERYQDSAWIGLVNGNMGTVYELQGEYDKAIRHYQTDLRLSRKYKEWGSMVSLLGSLGNLKSQQGNQAAARAYFEEALAVAQAHGVFNQKEELYRYLADYYQKEGKYVQALSYLRQHQEIRDSIVRRTNQIEISRIQAAFNLDKKQSEIELLRKDNQLMRATQSNQQIIITAVLIIVVLLSLLSLLLYRSFRRQQRTNHVLLLHQEELQEKNEEIRQLNHNLDKAVKSRTRQLEVALDNLTKQHHELEQFSYIISHNLKSPIAHLTGLVSVFNMDDPADPSNEKILESLQKATRNLDGVVQDLNDLLVHRNNINQATEEVYFEEVMQAVRENLAIPIQQGYTQLVTNFSAKQSIHSIKSYIHSIVYNLVSNAIKYRSNKRTSVIELRTEIINEQICLSVADNGLGIDFNQVDSSKIFGMYQRVHLNVEGKGLGLYLVKSQVEALGGSITVESQPDVGTTFRIYLKDKEKKENVEKKH